MKYPFGVVHGRFQVFHLDHLKYVLEGAKRCEHLFVGITNPDPTLTKHDPANPQRSQPEANPFTYFERYLMIKESLLDEGLSPHEFSIVPFPINFPELWKFYVPLDAVFFLTIYDEWGRKKRELLEKSGLKVEVLWEKPLSQKGISATQVRNLIKTGNPEWKKLVPSGTIRVIEKLHLAEKLKNSKTS